MFTELVQQLDGLRSRTARFRRVALHVHSPDSHDWGQRPEADATKNDRARFAGAAGLEVYLDELRPHIDLVGITDHMRCNFANRSCAATVGGTDFAVLPGMEVNIRLAAPYSFARIHVLVLLPENSTNETFARLFHGQGHIPSDDQRTGQEEVRNLSLPDWVQRVHGENGLCIAAHVENNEGVRYLFRQTARELLKLFYPGNGKTTEQENDVPDNFRHYLIDSGIDAIEIHRSGDVKHYRWVSEHDGKLHAIATTLTFDAHCIEEFCRPTKTTHIKMTTLGLKGLKEAITFADTRIRYPDNLPDCPLPRLLGIQITGDDGSFFKDITVAVAENLNCIIGVRGSGKSTIVEALRYVFGYNRSLDEVDRLKKGILDLQKANLAGCLIRVAYRTISGNDRILAATFDPKSDYDTKVYQLDGEMIDVADVESNGDFPLRLFGWSEIENLGRDPSRQRDLLDRLVPELKSLLAERLSFRNDLAKNRGEVVMSVSAVTAAFNTSNQEIRRYAEYKADFEKQNTPEVKDLFSSLDLAQAKRKVIMQVRSNVAELLKTLNDTIPVNLEASLQDLLDKGGEALSTWWKTVEVVAVGLPAAQAGIQAAIESAATRLRAFDAVLAARSETLDASIAETEKLLQAKFAENDTMQKIADLRTNAAKRLERATELRTQYLSHWKELLEKLDSRAAIGSKLIDVQLKIGEMRQRKNEANEATLNRFLPEWMKVTIEFRPSGDTKDFADKLQSVFKAKGNALQPKRVRHLVERHTNPVSFGQMCRSGTLTALESTEGELEGKAVSFSADDVTFCTTTTQPIERDEHADVDVLTQGGKCLQTILELQETPWDDYEAILLNGSPVNERSPGQRSSAMLPLIALAETTPLIIDQPEDNLDKRLVGTVLMKVLAELKEKRQIIVCTHDPNILVGGDAEQVIVLEAESDRRGKVVKHGSIDNPDIVETVIDLLEGGQEAFENRKRRYNLQ